MCDASGCEEPATRIVWILVGGEWVQFQSCAWCAAVYRVDEVEPVREPVVRPVG